MNDKSKRRDKRKNIPSDLNAQTSVIEKYLSLNHNNIHEDDFEKIKNYYNHKIEEIQKNSNNFFEAEDLIKKNLNSEIEMNDLFAKNKSLLKELEESKKTHFLLSSRLQDKEKYSKMLIEKINTISQDKQKIITEESESRNNIVKETEAFVRGLQSKYEEELPEKKKLIEENQALRNEIDKCFKNSGNLKDLLENQLSEKEKMSEVMENKIKNDLKSKMETMSFEAQKYIFENSELKMQIVNYKKKNEELGGLCTAYTQEYDKLKKELDKKKKDLILLSAENYELNLKFKLTGKSRKAIELAYAEHEKINSQTQAMKKLNTKLLEQFEQIKKTFEEKNLNINDF